MAGTCSTVPKIGDPSKENPTLLAAERKRSSAKKSLDEVAKLMGEMKTDIQVMADMVKERKQRISEGADSKTPEKEDDEPWEVKPNSSNRSNRSNSSLSGMIKAGVKGVAAVAKSVRKSSNGSRASDQDQGESFMENRN
mmetsp:Transcript_55347/g.87776  ORF Transcript_55347/g.87776 Transcript_55347/m.87776 type:complete len:139 (-) Transcript_55347:150-566(-)|eukprot:CAMPEP_0169121054 /NCGR_PEP_ID=MMETSP1015-20121227/32453_1 /TAXON_ID=342587 /ORGANISM="Karlodinium micrum, Strain CCMP2283" /LENGTH=138 /DNA_ID=CAMNT_0009184111 /DNA_START=54 /DNA_END=470 /DNA_ORIENTATION=+